jgi:hypothetical protein
MTSSVITGWSWLRRLRGQSGTSEGEHLLHSESIWRGDSEFAGARGGRRRPSNDLTIADIPVALKRRLQEEAVQATFHRLEMPLRFLLYATAAGREPSSVEEYQDIVNLWRQGLETEARLQPDNFAGAVRCYDPAMEDAYTVKGRCQPGQQLRITVPAWRLYGQVVVRGEAEPCEN